MGTNQRSSDASPAYLSENSDIFFEHEVGSESDVVEVLKDELVRHELFHEAVKQAVAQRVQNADVVLSGEKERVRYANVLTSQELKFLLECELPPQDALYEE